MVPVGGLTTYHRNPRRGNIAAIADSLRVNGQYRPIVVNRGGLTGRANEILAGNHTYAAAISIGMTEVEVTFVDVDDTGAARIVAADNRTADLGGYDDEALAELLCSIGDLEGTGYEPVDLAALLRDLEEPVALNDPDDVPDKPEVPISVPGDVWELGPHRLLVGSAGDVDDIRKLAPVVDCVWTDPPYGVNYEGGTGLTVANDGADEAFVVLREGLATIVELARPGAPVYVCYALERNTDVRAEMAAAGLLTRQTLLWVKDSLVMSRADYHYQHEPILEAVVEEFDPIEYGFTPGGAGRLGRGGPHWYGDNKSSTVFQVARPKRSTVHPTMKPVELVERMLRNSCPPGGIVLDLYAGSGSTMIAAHRLGLRSVLVELDPKYADVICRRWQEHTGGYPVRNEGLVDFSEV